MRRTLEVIGAHRRRFPHNRPGQSDAYCRPLPHHGPGDPGPPLALLGGPVTRNASHRPDGPLDLVVDTEAADPPYEQIRERIAARARGGELPVGAKLPTVRGLAQQLGLAANTVAKAYRALEADGVIETRGRNGTFVAAAGDAAQRESADAALAYARRAQRLGLDHDEALAAVVAALRATYGD
ncbi:hypothetical protein DEH18_10635 [Streptomyces sp. NHF165]|nr:hypothetical protein DEH18_10635 [Streptomyces sp. NHF165]